MSVIYTALVDPVTLADSQYNRDVALYERFRTAFTADFDEKDLSDGWAIMTHDAMLATATALNRFLRQTAALPTPTDIYRVLRLLPPPRPNTPGGVLGAGGTFGFNPETGDAVGRRIPVLELGPDGSARILGVHPQPGR